ncbi:M14 family metallocarboxypeptidase [Alkalihalophilus pseudofirmus]|uniref:M14 family metallocarboxypeptidase n=1 Tax=Alkalihalophilus pseudofirmus TaxID=79885 RepID=A0AAJ2U379_ALKPS|nr:M14 family metallocarboxypeptidase [Alkalihalophilus pseudofirmus]MDV2886332.1 M14 family metallocarboxypeptidase [Alkalihalophilus pseudofirmus]
MNTIRQLFKQPFIIFILILCLGISLPNTADASVVEPKHLYTYAKMEQDIKRLAQLYPDLIHYEVIGKSEYGRNIYAVSLGKGESTIFINGSHHAREWMTTNLNMYMLEQYAQGYRSNRSYDNGRYPIRQILNNTTIWFVPMVNPDGVELQQNGLSSFPSSAHSSLVVMNNGSRDFRRWKANAKGIDLNRQYNANWPNIRSDPGRPSFANHKGPAPHSSSETKAIVDFTHRIDPEMAVNYHSSGEVMYWNFLQTGAQYTRDLRYARAISSLTGYRLIFAGSNPSGGGMTDWFIQDFKRPAFTPELGRYVGPTNLPLSAFDRIWVQNRYVGLYVAQEGHKLYQQRLSEIAPREVTKAEREANALTEYYIPATPADVALTPAFQAQYDKANEQINHAAQVTRQLPSTSLKRSLQDRLNRTVELRRRATVMIRVINRGELLNRRVELLKEEMARGTLSDRIRIRHDNVLLEMGRTEEAIERVVGIGNRRIVTEAYLPEAYEYSSLLENIFVKYDVLLEIENALAIGKVEEVEALFTKLEQISLPSDPKLTALQTSLTEMERDLRATYEASAAASSSEEPLLEAASSSEEPAESSEERPEVELVEFQLTEENILESVIEVTDEHHTDIQADMQGHSLDMITKIDPSTYLILAELSEDQVDSLIKKELSVVITVISEAGEADIMLTFDTDIE